MTPSAPTRPRCICGHPLDEHDETGRCIPMVMVDASQGMGVLVQGRCSYDCTRPRQTRLSAFDWTPGAQWFVDDLAMTWEGSAFAATPGDVPSTLVPDWIPTVFVQVASGTGPPGAPLTSEKIAEMRESGIRVEAWAWAVGPNEPGGGEPEDEAVWHARCAREIGASTFVANLERFYDAHGDQTNPRYAYPRRYLAALDWDGALGLTTTPAFGSDMTDWVKAGACYMPQAFPLENGYDIGAVMQPALDWGWPVSQVRPLLQCYETNNRRPDPVVMREQANDWGVGVVPYTIEQAMDPEGQAWLDAMQECIIRPQPTPEEPDVGETIGPNHGATAACNRLRFLDPKGTKVNQVGGKWEPIETLTIPLDQWGAWDKLERSLKITFAAHDEIEAQVAQAETLLTGEGTDA